MKKITLVFAILFAAGLTNCRAQDTWTQKVDFGGTARYGAVGFSIGSKGYIGTGFDGSSSKNDFWEYDLSANVWTQKANFSGTAREYSVGFSIGYKGYIGTGFNNTFGYKNDFWEYDLVTNTWTQKTDFEGTARIRAVGFSIGSKGYIGTGYDDIAPFQNDFWEYDPATNTWTQKADFGGTGRFSATGFCIGSKGYIGIGVDEVYPYYKNDFWEYDPATNTWTQKADFGGTARQAAVGFSIGSKGYIGIGGNDYAKIDFWEYDATTNGWTKKANFEGTGRYGAVGFSIGSKGYIGTGVNNSYTTKKDFWEYSPDTSSCSIPTNLSATNITSSSAKLKWNPVAGAEGYTVRYKVSNTSEWKYGTTYNNSKPIGELLPNTIYKWEVRTYCQLDPPHVNSDWSSKQEFTTGSLRMSEGTPVEGDELSQQISFQIYPNPAVDQATIQFTLPQSSHVYIKVYDVSGKEIETLLDRKEEQGEHSLTINTTHFLKGVYLVKIVSDFGIENQKMIVI